MAISDYKITAADLDGKGNVGMPDTPNLTTSEMQAKLDELSRDVIIPKYNDMVDYIGDTLDIDESVTSEDIKKMRLDEDGKIQVSTDGESWVNPGASGHLLVNGSGTIYPTRSRMQFSNNVTLQDIPDGNATLVSVPSGEKGDKGDAATITVGNVVSGDTPSVTNVGSETDAVFDFVLAKGQQGSAATIQVGTVSSGTNASVSNRGTTSAAIFDFVLPKGQQGDPGTGLTLLGHYDTLALLKQAHPTGVRGNAYDVGIVPDNTVYLWNPDENDWKDVGSLKGAKGDQGSAGTITIGEVTESDEPTVENVGTSENAILNFGLQKGDKGDKGDTATITIGEVTEGDYPNVINRGTSSNAILDFTLQRGPQGLQGNPTTVNGKTGVNVTLNGADIALDGYEKASEYTDIEETDTINEAIGKLEARNSGGSVINLTIDEDSIGNTITAVNGTESYSKVATSTLVVFNVAGVGEWTLSDGDLTTTVNITFYGVYNASLMNAFVLAYWLEAGGVTQTFSTLAEVLADEKTVRQLMNKHAAVDYLVASCETALDENVETIINNDYCAKWINLRDYALDTLYANEYIAESMDTADKYFYGEWVERDGVWGAKGNVPIMTSNSAPYGVASAYQVFDGSTSTSASGTDFSYQFVNPISIKKFESDIADGTLQVSDNGTNWITNDNGYHLYARVHYSSSKTVHTIQFYGRELKASVPVMTSNTEPWGECSASKENGTEQAWKLFDGNTSTYWSPGAGNITNEWVQYDFKNPMVVKTAIFTPLFSSSLRCKNFKILASNDNFVSDTHELYVGEFTTNAAQTMYINVSNGAAYKCYRLFVVDTFNNTNITIEELQFYGLDYSEHEERHWIYDHGVEVETVEADQTGTGVASKLSDYLKIQMTSGTGGANKAEMFTSSAIELTNYSLLRMAYDKEIAGNPFRGICQNVPEYATFVASGRAVGIPYHDYLDISNINGNYHLMFGGSSENMVVTINEWWLE